MQFRAKKFILGSTSFNFTGTIDKCPLMIKRSLPTKVSTLVEENRHLPNNNKSDPTLIYESEEC